MQLFTKQFIFLCAGITLNAMWLENFNHYNMLRKCHIIYCVSVFSWNGAGKKIELLNSNKNLQSNFLLAFVAD